MSKIMRTTVKVSWSELPFSQQRRGGNLKVTKTRSWRPEYLGYAGPSPTEVPGTMTMGTSWTRYHSRCVIPASLTPRGSIGGWWLPIGIFTRR